jgi:hypothetical protein
MTATPFFAKFPLGPQARHGVPSATCLFTFVLPTSQKPPSDAFHQVLWIAGPAVIHSVPISLDIHPL